MCESATASCLSVRSAWRDDMSGKVLSQTLGGL